MKPGAPRLSLDGALVPGLLLLIARDLLLHDPPRVLAWRLLHDPRFAALPAAWALLLPSPPLGLDRDPIALALAAIASGAALAYLVAALFRARPLVRSGIIGAASLLLVVLPSLAFVALGVATGRPYGQDGGVVQLPLAMDRVLAGDSPYGADYSDSILGKEARVSDFWAPYGGNPILHHHAYLPGTHAAMLPAYLACRALGLPFDARLVTLLAYALAAWLAASLATSTDTRLAAAALVLLNPLAYWHLAFGANDILVVTELIAALWLTQRGFGLAAAAALGLACATKQLAWPFAPFLLVQVAGLRRVGELASGAGWRRLARPTLAAGVVFAAIVLPLAARDWGRFWGDIVVYNAGLPGATNYPIGGTPGFGFANFLIVFGAVRSLGDYFPFGIFYVLLLPLGAWLLVRQFDAAEAGRGLVSGAVAFLAAVYFSRVVHPNYLAIAAILLPLGCVLGRRFAPDVAAVPLLLLGLGAETADGEVFRTAWEDGLAVRLPQHLTGLAGWLAPRAGPELTRDPLGLLFAAVTAGLGLVYLVAGVLKAGARARLALLALAFAAAVAVPTLAVVRIGRATGQVRSQEPWTAAVVDAAERSSGRPLSLPPRQAWSTSFERDPPAALAIETARGLGSEIMGRALGWAGARDPRPIGLATAVVAALLLAPRLPREQLPLLAGAGLLAPAVLGVPFGSNDALLTAAVLFSLWAGRKRPWLAAAGCVFALLLLPRGLTLAPATLEPGLGLPNLLLYRGAATSVSTLLWLVPWLVAAVGAWWLRRTPGPAEAAALLLAVMWTASGSSALDLGLPLLLILLAAVAPERQVDTA